ncbi:MAG: 3-phosphoshikimate 1-carboxyvinyltransferase, partial [Proteobacteria bacterium]|nr:3-phosphoshikimate 1-carboxyvinyltransferase [Pseudomonadota bacterium]
IVPADISSAAFPLIAAAIVPGSAVTVRRVGLNVLRAGVIDCLTEMGADITVTLLTEAVDGGEPIADIDVRSSTLKGITVPAGRAPSMIDEYPILAMAAACAEGTTLFEGVAELRVKESDRLHAIAEGLSRCGVEVAETEDSLTIHGRGKPPVGGGTIGTDLDHRIAMAFLALGAATEKPITIDDAAPIDTSFPGFADLMNGLGAELTSENG